MKVFFTLFLFPLLFSVSAQTSLGPCDFNLGPDVMVCNNAVFNLNPHPIPGGSYAWTGAPGLSCYNCPTPQVSGLSTGVYTYVATVTTSNCTSSDTLVITVVNGEAPQYEIGESTGMCMGDSISLGGTAVPGTFYNWFSVPAGFVSTLANPKAKPVAQTTYYLLASNSICPIPSLDSLKTTPITLNLTVLPSDTVKICKGESYNFQATISPAGQPIAWTPPTNLQIFGNGTTVVASPTETTPYTATAMLGGCIRQRQIYVAVDSLPAGLEISPLDTSICQGQIVELKSNADLSGYPNSTVAWSPASGALTPTNLLNLSVQPVATALYKRNIQNGACADTVQSLVRVLQNPIIVASPEISTICQGDTVRLGIIYTPGLSNINWTPTAGLSCTTCDNPLAQPMVSTTYIVSGNLMGCTASDTVMVNVLPLPPLKFPDKVQLCQGDSVRLNELFDPLATYTWTSTHPGFGTVIKPDPSFYPDQTATYYVTANNGCTRTDSIKIFVSTAGLTVEGDTTICKNFSAQLSASSNVSGSFKWRNDLTGAIVSTMQAVSVSPAVTTPYTLIFIFGNCEITESLTVTIDGEAPALQFPSDTKLCPDEILPLNSGPVLPGTSYLWTAIPNDPSLVDTATAPAVMPSQNTRYAVTATLGNCTVSKTLDVTVFNANLTISDSTTICAGSPVNLIATGTNSSGSYLWSTGSTNPSITPSPLIPTTYTVSYLFGDTCSLNKTVFVNVVDNFKISLQSFPDTNQVLVGTPVTLIAVADPPQNFSNFNLRWEETTVDTKLLPFTTESIEVVPSSNDTTVATVMYKLFLTTPNGCLKTADKTFKLIFPRVEFPNAFTPDGDGYNETFRMVLLDGLAKIDRMEIFNRWGQKIYESMEPDASWDGRSGGELAPADVYIYRVWWRRGDGALQTLSTGNLTLLR